MSENLKVGQLQPIYPAKEHEHMRALLDFAVEEYGDDTAFILKKKPASRKEQPTYKKVTYKELREDVRRLGTGLIAMGVRNARIAIIGENSYYWQLAYLTAMCGLGICVPLDKGLPYAELKTSILKSGSTVLIFDKKHAKLAEQLQKEAADPMSTPTAVAKYICMDDPAPADKGDPANTADANTKTPATAGATQNPASPGAPAPAANDQNPAGLGNSASAPRATFATILAKGEELLASGDTGFMDIPIDREALTALIFTSGTTSQAKAVMLSQRNIMYNVYAMQASEDIHRGDINIALLPYHHTFGASGQLLMYACGVTTVFCDGLKYIQKNLVEYGVSVFIGVPLLLEAMYNRIMSGIRKKGKQKTFERGLKISRALRKVHVDVRRKLFKDIHNELGGNLRLVVSGASALDSTVNRGYEDLGISVVQGYGMTESSPVIAGENLYHRNPGSIGLGFPGMEVEIADPNEEGIGEIIVRSPSVMMGYYQNEEETAKVLKDGWLHTGDLAFLDEKGYINITGRSKNVIVLKNGKNVYPEEIENIIEALPYVKENIVYGEPRREGADDKDHVLVAKIVFDEEAMKDVHGAVDEEAVRAVVERDIDKINNDMPKYKHIHRFIVQKEEMIKTTTGKVKRYEESKK